MTTKRVVLYARYSTDKQKPESIDDQFRDCRAFAARQGWTIVAEHADPERSGASMVTRPGLQALLHDARNGHYDIVLAEDLDRISRDLADPAIFFKEMNFAGVQIVTLSDGVIGAMHIGFKGTMNAMFLDNLRQKTRRGLRGRIEVGQSAGGLSFGYQVVSIGSLAIVPQQADTVVRICRMFVAGVSPKAIAKRLNGEGIPGPASTSWSPSTIHGHAGRGTGILNNELYIGKRIWNRQRFVKDPNTGKRVARLNPLSEWVIKDVPHLRIVDEELWAAVKARQMATRQTVKAGIVRARRPLYLFSGLTKCGTCGGGYNLSSRETLRCFNHVARGTCTNTRTITRQELEARIVRAMQERFFEHEAFEAFCQEFTAEMNRLRRQYRVKLAAAPREVAGINRRSKEILELLLQGFRDEAWKEELRSLEQRRTDVLATIANAASEPTLPALHPHMAEVFRQKTVLLADALEHPDDEQRDSARQALRGFIDKIIIPPGDGLLQVVGNLGEMLTAAGGKEAVAYVGCGGGI